MNTWKNTVKRAVKTFIQAALGFAVVNATGYIGDDGLTKSALAALFVAAISAGLAALMNLPDHAGKANGVEYVEGPAVTKRIGESLDDLPLAGQDEPEESDNE